MKPLILVIALTPLKYMGQRIDEGAEFGMAEADVDGCLSGNLIAFAEDSSVPGVPLDHTQTADNQRTMGLIDAIESLDVSDVDLWTKDGRPKTEAIEAVGDFGIGITASLRDEIWADMLALRD